MPLFVGKGLETIPLKWTPDDLETKPMRKTGFLYGSGLKGSMISDRYRNLRWPNVISHQIGNKNAEATL